MNSPYCNRLPMAYLPASRAVDMVGLHPMFYGRVNGVGVSVPTAEETRLAVERDTKMAPALREYQRKFWAWNAGLSAAQSKCPPSDPNIRFIQALVCQPAVDYMRANPKPAPPSGATQFELRLVEATPPSESSDVIVDGLVPANTSKSTGSALPLLLGAAYLLLS